MKKVLFVVIVAILVLAVIVAILVAVIEALHRDATRERAEPEPTGTPPLSARAAVVVR
jgi:uncharacterized membrane protein